MKGRVVAYAAGGGLIAVGTWGLLNEAGFDLVGWALWFGGVVVVHDGVLVPCVLAVGALTARLPAAYRGRVQGALMVAGVLTLVAMPFVLGMGRRADNPSILPLHYGRNLLAVLAVVAVVAAVWRRYDPFWRRRGASTAKSTAKAAARVSTVRSTSGKQHSDGHK